MAAVTKWNKISNTSLNICYNERPIKQILLGSLYIGKASYNNVVHIKIYQHGLYLNVWPFFIFHKPIFIPIDKITIPDDAVKAYQMIGVGGIKVDNQIITLDHNTFKAVLTD